MAIVRIKERSKNVHECECGCEQLTDVKWVIPQQPNGVFVCNNCVAKVRHEGWSQTCYQGKPCVTCGNKSFELWFEGELTDELLVHLVLCGVEISTTRFEGKTVWGGTFNSLNVTKKLPYANMDRCWILVENEKSGWCLPVTPNLYDRLKKYREDLA